MALCLLSAGAVYGYVRYRIDSIQTAKAPHLTPQTDAGGPENILLIGNQTRAGLHNPAFGSSQLLSGSLSDVIMVLHLDPAKKSASLLSIPRDVFAPMPPGSPVGPFQKIDAALNDGSKGIDNLIQAITDDFGIPINHYVELKFNGLEGVVNALGGINVYFPEPVYDAYSLLYIAKPGCVHLNGAGALALVRARHLQYDPPGDHAPRADWPYDPRSDLARIVRDHTFLRILAATAKSEGLTNPIKLNSFLGAILGDIVIDPGFKSQLLSLAVTYRHVNPATIPATTLPVTVVNNYYYGGAAMGDVDFPVQPKDNQVIGAWDSGALPQPAAPTSVQVYNLAGTYELAARTAQALRADGLPAQVAGNSTVPGSPTETYVQYPPGSLAQAMAVMKDLSGAVMLQADSSLPAGTVAVQAGSLLSVVPPASTPSSSSGPSSSASSSTGGTSSSSASVPTPGGQPPSPAKDLIEPWDPRACPGHS